MHRFSFAWRCLHVESAWPSTVAVSSDGHADAGVSACATNAASALGSNGFQVAISAPPAASSIADRGRGRPSCSGLSAEGGSSAGPVTTGPTRPRHRIELRNRNDQCSSDRRASRAPCERPRAAWRRKLIRARQGTANRPAGPPACLSTDSRSRAIHAARAIARANPARLLDDALLPRGRGRTAEPEACDPENSGSRSHPAPDVGDYTATARQPREIGSSTCGLSIPAVEARQMQPRVAREIASLDVDPRVGVVGRAMLGSGECGDDCGRRLW